MGSEQQFMVQLLEKIFVLRDCVSRGSALERLMDCVDGTLLVCFTALKFEFTLLSFPETP